MRPVNPVVRFAVERRVTMAMAVVGILVLGWLSLLRLPLEFLPTFSSSSITVTAPYPSSSPQEIERLIVRPLEDSLGTINGIETMAAGASANSGRVTLTFIDGTDMELAAVEVRDRIDRARYLLPDDLQRISMRRFQSSAAHGHRLPASRRLHARLSHPALRVPHAYHHRSHFPHCPASHTRMRRSKQSWRRSVSRGKRRMKFASWMPPAGFRKRCSVSERSLPC